MSKLFAIDHNFPVPIVETLAKYQSDAEVVSISEIDPRMSELEDWEILLTLHLHERAFDGLITQDDSMLSLEREVSVLVQTKLTLIVPLKSGSNPIKSTGLLFAYLSAICGQTTIRSPQVWRLGIGHKPPKDGWDCLRGIADKNNESAQNLFDRSKLSPDELLVDPLSDDAR